MPSLERHLRAFLLLLATVALALVVATPALAQPKVKPGGDALGMIGYVIDDIDLAGKTLTVAGETYHVTPRSVLQDTAGSRIGLGDLRGMQSHGVADMVKITSTRNGQGGKLVVRELSIVDLGRP